MSDVFFEKKYCDRCGGILAARIMSMFNSDCICMECKDTERRHSRYKEAQDADITAIRNGNYNYKGLELEDYDK
ncbi:hypothetical protein [Butyrivibrio fibrisolvens]|uniref:hypothetical protein n=1 Tax=Butyrivibrio fibrisolvens TaxID=831 RepID=UPI0003B3C13E|nr:hypothetical protein [Butyrivibrio fibrisolvens]